MAEIIADLHLHSTFSDGLLTPEELAEMALSRGLKALSLTDHDSVGGLSYFKNFTKATFIPGIELSATEDGKEVHILGYYINPETPELLETLKQISSRRVERIFDIVDSLNESCKAKIDKDELALHLGDVGHNRLNLARFMVKKSISGSIAECFRDHIGNASDSYRPVDFFSPIDAIKLIKKSGGLAFIAHPYHPNSFGMIPELVEHGLDGVEAFHPSHGPNEVKRCLQWAGRFNIGVSGGSDYHGDDSSPRQILSAGLDGERLVDFMALNPNRDFVTA